jgi:hypothetical protein
MSFSTNLSDMKGLEYRKKEEKADIRRLITVIGISALDSDKTNTYLKCDHH